MNRGQELLWQKVENFNFDDGAKFSFTKRLARENGWSTAYADAVIAEYKKFIFLCCVSESGVTPSDQVDQAWHLHLTYTKSYWIDLCDKTLGRPIHHNPTKGGHAEHKKFGAYYTQTQMLYRNYFGSDPPQDIWPSNVERFSKTEFRRVDLNKNWLFPRNLMSPGACFLLAVVLFSPLLIQASSNHGWGIITLFAVLFVIVFIWRSFKKSDNESGCSTGGCSGDSDSSDSGDSGCACSGCGGE